MKRLISILVIVAMMLASVLAMIPAFAADGEGEGAEHAGGAYAPCEGGQERRNSGQGQPYAYRHRFPCT